MDIDELLQNAHAYTEDVIVITEAEPQNATGPRILFVNKAFEKQTGYSADEVIGKNPRLLQGEDTCPLTRARIRRNMAQWKPIREEILNYRKDGTPFWIEMSIDPVADGAGWYRYWISVQRDITRRKEIDAQLLQQRNSYRRAAITDELTQLLNRRGLKETTTSMHAAAGDTNSADSISLFLIDLDRFKVINDTLGHEAGDLILKETAQRLRTVAHQSDVLARMDGDELLVLRTRGATADLKFEAERLREALSRPIEYQRQKVRCDVSVGAASGTLEQLASGALFRRADLALYYAKGSGRGLSAAFEESMERHFFNRATLASDLLFALEQNGLSVQYMPKVETATGKVIGFEALARWFHPIHGSVSPDEFIPLAEEIKVVELVDRFVLHQVAADRDALIRKGRTLPPISVNISSRRLRDPNFLADLDALDLTGSEISVELVETVLLDSISELDLSVLDGLRQRGIKIELDDFGSGHASMLSVTQIRPDWLKIDRRFVMDIDQNPESQHMVGTICAMARVLGIKVIAEGVETELHANILMALGCGALQGYLFGKPSSLIEAFDRNAARDTLPEMLRLA